MHKRVLIQINGCTPKRPDPVWTNIATQHGIDTVWWDTYCDGGKTDKNFDLIIVQAATTNSIIETFYWHRDCPAIGICGDALPGTNIEVAFKNLQYLTAMYVEGYDYWPAYKAWLTRNPTTPDHSHKLRFLKTCADIHFQPLTLPKIYNWCFAGLVYPPYPNLKHYRNHLIPAIKAIDPNGIVLGAGWPTHNKGNVPQNELNQYYAQANAVLCIDAHNGPGYTSTRTLEVMHAGHLPLIYKHDGWDQPLCHDTIDIDVTDTTRRALPGLPALSSVIRDYEHCLYFQTPEEAIRKAREATSLPEEAEGSAKRIGQAARKLVIEKGWSHTGWLHKIIKEFYGHVVDLG